MLHALTSKRPYKEPFDFAQYLDIMKQQSGKHFDPELFQIFSERIYSIYQEIAHAPDAVLESELAELIRKHFYLKTEESSADFELTR